MNLLQTEYANRLKEIYGPSDSRERAQWLKERADNLDRDAERLEGTCWLGDMSPSSAKRLEASRLREHAMLLLRKSGGQPTEEQS